MAGIVKEAGQGSEVEGMGEDRDVGGVVLDRGQVLGLGAVFAVAISEKIAAGIVAESGHAEGVFTDYISVLSAVLLCHLQGDASPPQVVDEGERWDGMGLANVDGRGCRHGRWDSFG
jgi:hypothetical protein